jgi:nitrogen fixation NifU-like protein
MTSQLYNDAILAEAKAAVGSGTLPAPDASVICDNPLCGDRVAVDLSLSGARIGGFAHRTRGCLLTQAAASVVGRHVAGANGEEIRRAANELRRLLAGEPVVPGWPELAMFAPVSAVRSRHECVLLPFDALTQALEQAGAA